MRLGLRIKSTTTSSGQGDLTLGAAAPRHLAVSTLGLAANEMQAWLIEQGDAWEIGWYGYNAGVVLRASTGFLVASSTGAKLVLSGTSYVSIADLAQQVSAITPTATPSLGAAPVINANGAILVTASVLMGPSGQGSGSAGDGGMTAIAQSGVSSGNAGTAIGLQASASTRNVSLGYLAGGSNDGYSMQYWTAGGGTASGNGHILQGPRLDRPWPGQRSRATRNDSLPLVQELDADLFATTTTGGSNIANLTLVFDGITGMTVPTNRALAFDLLIQAVRLSDGAAWLRRFEGLATRLTGNIALQGTPLETAISATAGFAPSVGLSADTVNQVVRVQATGTETPIRWHARARTTIGKLA
jgi:hypothetical protein